MTLVKIDIVPKKMDRSPNIAISHLIRVFVVRRLTKEIVNNPTRSRRGPHPPPIQYSYSSQHYYNSSNCHPS